MPVTEKVAAVSTIFVLVSGSDELKQGLKNKMVGFCKVRWMNVFREKIA